jgi:hypothetical protein
MLLSYFLALVCLVWVFHDVQIRVFLVSFRRIRWVWMMAAILLDILSYVCQGMRWERLLRPVGAISWRRATQAIYAGLFTSEILPMRPGEWIRAYLVSHWLGCRFAAVLPSLATERLIDGFWLAIAFGLTAMLYPLPKNILRAGDVLGGLVLVGTGLIGYIIFRKRNAPETGGDAAKAEPGFFTQLADGLNSIGTSRFLLSASAFSLLLLVFQALAFFTVLRGCRLQISLWPAAVVFLIVHLGTAVPNAPGNVGTYQFFCVTGLQLFGVDKNLAAGFSVIVFVILTLPLLAIGYFALARSGMSMAIIRNTVTKRARQPHP